MANIDDGFRLEIISFDDQALITAGDTQPILGGGYEAPQGSLYLRTNTGTDGEVYVKFGPNDVDWLKVLTSGQLDIQDEGTPVSGGPFTTLNFVGAGITASDGGSGVADITVTGSGGGSAQFVWKFDDSTTAGDPSAGFFRLNNSDPALATEIYISEESETGADVATLLNALSSGDSFYIQEIEDSSNYTLVDINTVTDNGSWVTLGVTTTNSGTLFTDGKECGGLLLFRSGGGGGGNPAPPDTSVQFNNSGSFGGDANFTYDSTDDRVLIQGIEGANHEVTYAGSGNLQIADRDEAVSYIQVDGDATYEAMRVKFQRSTAGISGWISMYYDQATPSLRLTDEDDDSPYITFDTIGAGTYDLPEYLSVFGARGPVGFRDPGVDTNGFVWLIGANTTPESLYAPGTYDPAMELDQHWLLLPTGAVADRPTTPQNGMVYYNTDGEIFEGYENGAWVPLVSVPKQSFHAHNGTATQVLTTGFVTAFIATDIRVDGIYSNTNGEVTVNKTTNIEVQYEITGNSTGPRSSMECVLQVNNVDVPGTFAYGYHRNSASGENTAVATALIAVTSGDVVRVRIREINGAIVTVANACRLTIKEID